MLKKIMRRLAQPIADFAFKDSLFRNQYSEMAGQKALIHSYRAQVASGGGRVPCFADAGFRVFSEFEEDGVLLLIFALLGATNRTCVEICAGNGLQCNTANLIVNHGWWGHLFDGDERNVSLGRAFFRKHRDTFLYPPRFTHAWITAENVNHLVSASGASGDIDLLSLDIDGMDYWIWSALETVQPRVVICEVSNSIPSELALTVPYDPAFVATDGDYRGASLRAMVNLGRKKGYRLVGTHRYGFNAFFIRNGIGEEFFPEISPSECAKDPFTKLSSETRWPGMKSKAWVEV